MKIGQIIIIGGHTLISFLDSQTSILISGAVVRFSEFIGKLESDFRGSLHGSQNVSRRFFRKLSRRFFRCSYIVMRLSLATVISLFPAL